MKDEIAVGCIEHAALSRGQLKTDGSGETSSVVGDSIVLRETRSNSTIATRKPTLTVEETRVKACSAIG